MEFKREELEQMKRADLQKICKSHGIKANMKTTKLVEGLLQLSANELSTILPEVMVQNESASGVAALAKSPETKVEENEMDQQIDRKEGTLSVEAKSKIVKSVLVKKPQPLKGSSKIPRLTISKLNKNCTPKNNPQIKTPKRNTAPKDWSKIHGKQFDKMDSLGDYLEKKRKRAADLTGSVKKVKLAQNSNQSATKKSVKLQTVTSKTTETTTPKMQNANPVDKKKRLTFNFTKTAKENALITPGKVKRRATLGAIKTPSQGTQQKPATPFRFSAAANTTVDLFSPTPRKNFDLKASLAKPLGYKPYTGKLPTLSYAKQQKISSEKKNVTHQRDIKAVKVISREGRREKRKKDNSKKRNNAVCKRRGVIR